MGGEKSTARQPAGAQSLTKAGRAVPQAPTSTAFEHLAFQLNTPASGSQEEDQATAAGRDAVRASARYGIIIEDGLPAGEGQINRTQFMDEMSPRIESAAGEILTPAGRDVRDCPYLGFWLTYYRNQSASHMERAIARYVRPARTDLAGIEEAILEHVRVAVRAWVDRREVQVSSEVDWRVDDDRVESPAASAPAAQLMNAGGEGSPAAPGSAAAIRSRLSEGRPLEPAVRGRMEQGFGTSFGDVRLHDDAHAAAVAGDYRARAFTVGQDVGFAPGQYRPGTMAGDLLLAHELAHTIQQRAAVVEGAESQDLETDATLSAAGAVLPQSELGTIPTRRGGLGLRRCGTGEEQAPSSVSDAEYNQTMTELRQLYARKKAIEDGTAPATDTAEIDRRIAELSEKVKGWGVQLSDRQLRRAAESGEDIRARKGKPLQLDPDEMADRGYKMIVPPGEPTVGRTYELSVEGPLRAFASGEQSTSYAGSWYVMRLDALSPFLKTVNCGGDEVGVSLGGM